MKTALTELIEKWEIEKGSYIPTAPIYSAFIEEAKCFLEKEKQQIIDAWVFGKSVGYSHSEDTSEQYYSETFNNND